MSSVTVTQAVLPQQRARFGSALLAVFIDIGAG